LVTGASRGIGAAIATLLAERGGKIAVHYGSNEDAAQAVCNSLNGVGHRIFGCDLADATSAPDLVERVVEAFGRIDVLINNAGAYIAHPVLKVTGDEWL
jgi:3-oxoacyl-[acyl-carrier protein] reductase